MNFIQRGFRSILRKPLKSILLLFCIIFICIFFLAGLASRTASVKIQTESKEAVGSGFQITENIDNMRERLVTEGVYTYFDDGSVLSQAPNNQFDSVLMDDILKIASVNGVISHNIVTAPTVVMPVNFERIYDRDRDQSKDYGGVNLVGNLDMSRNFAVADGYITLKEGRFVTQQDHDALVISEALAELNGLSPGDTMSFNSRTDPEGSEVYQATIVGIFTITQNIPTLHSGDTYRSENTIFTDLRFPEKPEGHTEDPLYAYATFQIDDPDNYDSIMDEALALNITWARYDIINSSGISDQLASSFTNIEQISKTLLVVVAVSGFLILLLIFIFWIKNRNHEIGILLALGESKGAILSQLMAEAVLLATAAFGAALAIAPLVSGKIASYLVYQQVDTSMVPAADTTAAVNGEIAANAVSGISVDITITMISITGGLILLLVIASVCGAGIAIMKKKPIQILSDLS